MGVGFEVGHKKGLTRNTTVEGNETWKKDLSKCLQHERLVGLGQTKVVVNLENWLFETVNLAMKMTCIFFENVSTTTRNQYHHNRICFLHQPFWKTYSNFFNIFTYKQLTGWFQVGSIPWLREIFCNDTK